MVTPTLPNNWRPIALCPTISKIYLGLITKRINNWIKGNNILSHAQKGFRPYDGCFEHTYVIQERLRRARTNHSELCLLSLDITNAFGSVSHAAITPALKKLGIGDRFADIVNDMYNNAYTRLLTDEGLSEPIPITIGVKQGEPVSGTAFNIYTNPILRAVQGDSTEYKILAIADDYYLIANSIPELQESANKVCDIATKLGLKLNPGKCYSLHLPGGTIEFADTPVYVCGEKVTALSSTDSAPFLGKSIGLFQD